MGYRDKNEGVTALLGKILKGVEIRQGHESEDDLIVFACDDGSKYLMYHTQDCCESVCIEDIEGDLADLAGSPITLAEEATNSSDEPVPEALIRRDESYTWTFYRFATAKGFVTIRWYGSSNGYYSESVSFYKDAA